MPGIRPRIGIEWPFLVGQVACEEVADTRIRHELAAAADADDAVAEATRTAERRQRVALAVDDVHGRHPRPDVLHRRIGRHRRAVEQEAPKVSVLADVEGR